jgi:uncharacterized protein YqjF (DUF2071 family)
MFQRWNNLLFAHWPVPAERIAPLIPQGLVVDTFEGTAWVGVVPFFIDQLRTRTVGRYRIGIPTTTEFCELNLRTYVRSPASSLFGVHFFSLDAASLLAVIGARSFAHLAYFWANMQCSVSPDGAVHYSSQRLVPQPGVRFKASYRGLGTISPIAVPGTLEYFLTARYCLFTRSAGELVVLHIHHLPWPLEPAEAEIRLNQLPRAHGITLPDSAPLLHFSRQLEVYLWSPEPDRPRR